MVAVGSRPHCAEVHRYLMAFVIDHDHIQTTILGSLQMFALRRVRKHDKNIYILQISSYILKHGGKNRFLRSFPELFG